MSSEKNFKTFRKDFAYYDRTGIQEFLEQKAAEGWLLFKKQFAREWEFKRADPQKLHYAITYLPQISNEDSFLLSDNKKEYLDLCAESGWKFICAYKNMVIFANEEENPLPLETDPEAELAVIHKSFLGRNLPKIIFSFAVFTLTFFYLMFTDSVSEIGDLTLGLFAVLSFYTVVDFCGYLRWRKKALAAAVTGKFSQTGIPDKPLSALLIAFMVLCVVTIVVKSIITGNWATLIIMAVFSVAVAIFIFLDKLKMKTNSIWKIRIINFVLILLYFAATACVYFIRDLF